ncbi:MAG TPA: hypothetical protein VNG33_10770 [Polyangiaceae bacterium]|nr:hypothetical protein [Polyangiaceae bacterium]
MGAFFTNVQVRVGQPAKREAVADVLRGLMSKQGFIEVAGEQDAERSVVIGPAREGGWLAVYDEGTESQGHEALTNLALGLSAELGTALGVLVHDSDVLQLWLAKDGRLLDAFDSDPDYFDETPRKRKKRTTGKPRAWRYLLAQEGDDERLAQLWRTHAGQRAAETVLDGTGKLLGLHTADLTTGFRYLQKSGHLAEEQPQRLHFRLSERPAYERKLVGPPAFTKVSFNESLEWSLGDPLVFRASVHSMGGASRGLVLTCSGTAVEGRLFEPSRVRAYVRGNVDVTGSEAPWQVIAGEPQLGLVARFPELVIPAGLVDPYAGFRIPGLEARAHEALAAMTIELVVEGQCQQEGSGEVQIVVAPIENPVAGQARITTALQVTPRLRRPLRYSERWAGEGDELRDMADPKTLFALIPVGDQAEHVAAITRAIRSWLEALKTLDAKTYEVACLGEAAPRVRRPKVKAGAAAWGWLDEAIGHGNAVEALTVVGGLGPERDDDDELLAAGFVPMAGFELYSALFSGEEPGSDVSLLTLYCAAELDRFEPALKAIVDELFESCKAPQAALGRWRSEPRGNHIPYERVTGLYETTGSSWVTRYLKAVTPMLWLGADLLAHIDVAALSRCAVLTPLSGGQRVELREDSDLDALEQVLAPLLAEAPG